MSSLDHRALVAEQTARFVTLTKGADLTTPVPSCPGWTLLDLIRHTGSVQRWFSVLLRQQIQQRPTSRDVELALPAEEDGYRDWLAASATVAAEAFATVESDAPMWAWGADQHARFWARRMLCETLVHRVDAELALGLRPEIDPALAADAVAEFLVNLPFAVGFAPKTAQLRGTGETIRFTRTDGEGDWTVRLDPESFGLTPNDADGDTPADATVQGSAADLLLLLYGRLDRTAPGLEVHGDQELLARWFANSEF
ncbi:uncharacterized protein (TIGR03083 family) [Kitasatospora sp. GAS204A]|uniref:maleylpyruvate isomerase family mycothiol-dependent enzyme n=1 Tax=unclassified Kitasatospora TaxID=2633591 RepID=UPI00247584BC|nr:maleylpyruvate isomerase family mycothiol-dependent enzyme [Kitasatospora sp. GAS204B]MDH6116124.1 uncharacterized protein (TIGR03083 family) [Kitasatospora sp. GAS204B]